MGKLGGFKSRGAAMSYWYDTCPQRNDRCRYVKTGERWFVEERRGFEWVRRSWGDSDSPAVAGARR